MKMYSELGSWWPLLSPHHESEEESRYWRELLQQAPGRRLLELGSGGGNNAFFLRRYFELTLVDLSDQMLEVSRALNPSVNHIRGDMRSVRLGETFDAVFVHDAVDHMTTPEDLRACLRTAFVHLAERGVAIFCPDHVAETFVPRTASGGTDDGDRGLRYLEWSTDPDPDDNQVCTEYVYLLREGDSVRVVHERHIYGLFRAEDWMDWLRAAGFATVRLLTSPENTPVLVCTKA